MSFDFKEYLVIAEYLHANVRSEASIRTAISRAYYSVFSAAKSFCLNEKIINTFESKGPNCHAKVIDGLVAHDDRSIKAVGKKLESLREKRNDADYDSYNKEMTTSTLSGVIYMTKDVFSRLEELAN